MPSELKIGQRYRWIFKTSGIDSDTIFEIEHLDDIFAYVRYLQIIKTNHHSDVVGHALNIYRDNISKDPDGKFEYLSGQDKS